MKTSIIIGGGIIGMLTAWKLHRSGHQVTLIEKGETGRESSWAGGGIVSPLYPWRYHDAVSALARYGQQQYAQLCHELHEITGTDPEYQQSGLLIVAPAEENQAVEWAKTYYPSLSVQPADELGVIEPSMAASARSGIWMPEIGQVRNPRISRAFGVLMEKLGITVIRHTEIETFESRNGRLRAVKSANETFQADNYVVCSGAWSGELLKQTGLEVPVAPVKGQMILFKANPGEISRIVLEEDRYIIPRRDGRVLFGSTVENAGFNKSVSDAAKQELLEIATSRFPILKKRPVEHHWAGLRPGSPEGIPVIGRHPALENLFINAGHFRNGVVLAPGSCELVSRIMNDESSELDNPALSPARFLQ